MLERVVRSDMTTLRRRLLALVAILVVSVPVAGSPASGLSCIGLPENLLEGLAEGDAPDFWGNPDFVTTAVVGRVVDRAPDSEGLPNDGDWMGTLEVLYAIGRETVPATMDVEAGSAASEWGVGTLPAEGLLMVIYQTRAVGDPAPAGLTLDICPNSEALDEDRAEAARLLAVDLGTLLAEPGDSTTTTTTTTVPPTDTEPPTTTTEPPSTTTEPPTTTTTAPPASGGSDDESSNTWIVLLGIGVAAAVVVGVAAWGRLPGR